MKIGAPFPSVMGGEFLSKFNIEIASRAFPGTGTLSTLTHTTKEAIENNISLRELDLKQSVALCLVYLAKGYEQKFHLKSDDGFMMDCAKSVLKYDSMNLNAMLLEAEILENQILSKNNSLAQLKSDKTFREYNDLILHLFNLGYREMPLEMKNILIKGWSRDTVTNLATKNYLPSEATKNGLKPIRFASLSWGLFDEEILTKPVERYGRTLFNTKQKKISGFAQEQFLYNNYNFDLILFALSVDPLAEKYPQLSPYCAMADNPIKNIDPNGAEVVVSGGQSMEAVNQLRASVNTELSLSENGQGSLSYTQTDPNACLSAGAQQLVNAIEDKNITVNIVAENTKMTTAGKLYIGGTFSGNVTTQNQEDVMSPWAPFLAVGQQTVTRVSTTQEINPTVLGTADGYSGKPGTLTLHEATESYQGALISAQEGYSANRASNADINDPTSVYSRAHNAATPQGIPIYSKYLDAKGNVLPSSQGAARVDWYVQPTGKDPKVIMTYP